MIYGSQRGKYEIPMIYAISFEDYFTFIFWCLHFITCNFDVKNTNIHHILVTIILVISPFHCSFTSLRNKPQCVSKILTSVDSAATHNMKSPSQCPTADLHIRLCFLRRNWHKKSTIYRGGCIQHTELCVQISLISTFRLHNLFLWLFIKWSEPQ